MTSLYLRMALDNIRKNRRLYIPYVLTGCAMVTVVYLLAYLMSDPGVLAIPDMEVISALLGLGILVMGLFSTIFLFYTNSFLMKQRSRELGLYNVLGMTKGHILRVVFWETLLCALLAIVSGLALGILLSKLAALVLIKMMGGVPATAFHVPVPWLFLTALGFSGLYFLIFLRSAVNVMRVRPLELMRQAQMGEKPPKGNILFALLGVTLLLLGYALALRVKNPYDALGVFFIAVVLVILGTFGCFRSASVYVLGLLRRNKHFYYQPNHFISVSGMAYRMKRGGDSLATICILLTMVLVMMCSTTCLFFGIDDAVRSRYPYPIQLQSDSEGVPAFGEMRQIAEQVLHDAGASPTESVYYRSLGISGFMTDADRETGVCRVTSDDESGVITAIEVMPLEDYNAMMGTDYALEPGEALLGGLTAGHAALSRLSFFDGLSYEISEDDIELPSMIRSSLVTIVIKSMLVVIPDESDMLTLAGLFGGAFSRMPPEINTLYAFDAELPPAQHEALATQLRQALRDAGLPDVSMQVAASARGSFRALSVGFLALGLLLSIAFLCATALSMYYKQITEGLEDQSRFDIMRRVGLSRRMIRRSINSQLLAVFFSPLLLSGAHLAFAFPMLLQLLGAFSLKNPRLMALTTLCTYAVVAALYAVIYALTSRVYYRIVAGLSEH